MCLGVRFLPSSFFVLLSCLGFKVHGACRITGSVRGLYIYIYMYIYIYVCIEKKWIFE